MASVTEAARICFGRSKGRVPSTMLCLVKVITYLNMFDIPDQVVHVAVCNPRVEYVITVVVRLYHADDAQQGLKIMTTVPHIVILLHI